MKNYFKIGLMALTLAFGVTSCDKDNIGTGNIQLTKSDVKAGLASKVTFSEIGGFSNKGNRNLTAKNAAAFSDLHVYASTPQSLVITGNNGDYVGTYAAGDISSLNPADIILADGDYTAVSTNDSNGNTNLVTGFASYSSVATFNLSSSASIQLDVTHDRGFVIADSEAATDGSRITSVELSSGEISDNLIMDDDGTNDFYGYLEAGTYDVVINYTLDGSSSSVTGTVEITNGVASTLAPMLEAETPEDIVTTRSTTRTVSGTEAGLPTPRSINSDDDTYDDISRTIETIFTTTNGNEDDGVDQAPSAWIVTIDRTSRSITEDSSLGDAAAQAELDRIAAEEAAAAQAIIDAAAQVEADRLAAEAAATLAAEQAATAAALAAQVEAERVAAEEAAALLAATPDTLSEWSAYSADPGFGADATREENVSTEQGAPTSQASLTVTFDLVTFQAGYIYQAVRTRTVVTQNGDADADLVLSESMDVTIAENIVSTDVGTTRLIANDNYVAPSGSNDGDVDATATFAFVNPSILAGGFIYTLNGEAVPSSLTVEAGDVLVFAWTGGGTGTVSVTVTAEDIADGSIAISINVPFSSATKS